MTDATVGVIDQSGAGTKKVDVSQVTVGLNTVERQRVVLADSTGAAQFAGVSTGGGLHVEGVGSAGLATGQVALTGDVPVLIAAARTGPPGTGRVSISINNISAVEIWVGLVDVTSTTGFPLLAGESVTLQTTAAIYAVLSGAGTPTIGFIELF